MVVGGNIIRHTMAMAQMTTAFQPCRAVPDFRMAVSKISTMSATGGVPVMINFSPPTSGSLVASMRMYIGATKTNTACLVSVASKTEA